MADKVRAKRGPRAASATKASSPARGAARHDGAARAAVDGFGAEQQNGAPPSGKSSGNKRAAAKGAGGDRTYQEALAGSPITDLPPKAQEIIRAARRMVQRDGFAKLSFEAIAAEAGVYTSAIRYYFRCKGGLVEALVGVHTRRQPARVRAVAQRVEPADAGPQSRAREQRSDQAGCLPDDLGDAAPPSCAPSRCGAAWRGSTTCTGATTTKSSRAPTASWDFPRPCARTRAC